MKSSKGGDGVPGDGGARWRLDLVVDKTTLVLKVESNVDGDGKDDKIWQRRQ